MSVQTRDQALSNLFEQILQSLTHSQESLLSAPTRWRAELERQLSLAIVDEEYRGVYQHVLLKFGNNHHRTMPPSIPIAQIPTNLILKSGLGVLDDESLAKLSLDLFAIEPLADRYENATEPGSLGEIWYDLNIDGYVSDLTATFAIHGSSDGLTVALNDIHVM